MSRKMQLKFGETLLDVGISEAMGGNFTVSHGGTTLQAKASLRKTESGDDLLTSCINGHISKCRVARVGAEIHLFTKVLSKSIQC